MRLTLREYQENCVAAHFDFFANNPTGEPLIVMPTGSGKSVVIAEFVRRSLKAWPKTRFLAVTHSRELVQQNYDEFVGHWDESFHPAGIYSAGIGRRDTGDSVLFCGIQSIWNKAEDLGWFDIVLVDECHMLPKSGQGRYRTYLKALREINPAVRVVGYTATPFRMAGGYLHKGDDCLFTAIAYDVKLEVLIEGGYLVPLIAKQPVNTIDVSGIAKTGGDFNAKQLEAAAIEGDMVKLAVAETVEQAAKHNRHHWLIFATGLDHAAMIESELKSHDVECETVFGNTPKDERNATIARFKSGALTALVNVGVLTTGFNCPCCDLMAVMRPTQSAGLYVQIMGRGMWTFPGKADCLVLDFGLNVARHGPINRVKVRAKGDGPPPMKTCPECDAIVPAHFKVCDTPTPDGEGICGYVWPPVEQPREIKHDTTASTLAPFDPDAHKPQVMAVRAMTFRRHSKEGRPDSLRVDFACGLRTITDWICFEHGGWAQRKAGRWWFQFGGVTPVPETIGDAIARQHEIRVPSAIEVVADGEYDRIRKPIYEETTA